MADTSTFEYVYAYATQREAAGEKFAVSLAEFNPQNIPGTKTLALFDSKEEAIEWATLYADRKSVPLHIMPSAE